MTGISLGANQHGKAEVRLVKVARDTPTHTIKDLNVTSQLRGDFEAAFTEGDNSHVTRRTPRRTRVYALAKEHGIGSPEAFLLAPRRPLDGPGVGDRRALGARSSTAGSGSSPTARRTTTRSSGPARRPAPPSSRDDGDETFVVAGLEDCVVLKSTGSEFHGFPRDRYTTLAETDDRILATDVTAWWRYCRPRRRLQRQPTTGDPAGSCSTTFASVHSLALQQTVFAMGKAVLEAYADIAEIRLSCPNNHHFLVDLEPFGLDNPGEVFFAADRPYGLIEAAVIRDGVADEPRAWA